MKLELCGEEMPLIE